MKKIFILSLLSMFFFTACYDLDVPPKNLITDEELMTDASGMEIYMARLYSKMPLEDFKYLGEWGFNYNGYLNAMGIEGTGESTNRDGICKTFTGESTPYWNIAFELLRDANYLIETLPTYKDNYTEENYNNYIGEAYFVRALVFYTMAKRFGGVPLVTKVIQYPANNSELEVPRSTEEETWDQVLKDFDTAISLLKYEKSSEGNANLTTRGHVGKYTALAFKSEAMLYAGSIAKYNDEVQGRLTGLGRKTGVRVIGFAENSAKAASLRYFQEAFLAANEVIESNQYSLYMKKWAANDPDAQYQNMVDMTSDLNSPENIFVREYIYPTLTHGYDAYSSPFIFRNPLSSGVNLTLDFMELFEGFDRYPNGTVKVTTGNSNTEGEYLMYDSPMDLYRNVEPRLRAYSIFPGDVFKGTEIEIRTGIYTGSEPIRPFFNDYSYNAATTRYQDLDIYNNEPKTLYLGATSEVQDSVLYNGRMMAASGANGPFYSQGESALTGVLGRKWLNPDPSFSIGIGKSSQHFILMRYADILLNAAEAAVEIKSVNGDVPGHNLLDIATKAVNEIRERAGATLLSTTLVAGDESIYIVRKERRKELALENKTKWDLRRWRVQHYDRREGFWGEIRNKDAFSDAAEGKYRFRGLYPFLSTESGKYFFDARFQQRDLKDFTYNIRDYYFEIPGNEVTKSRVIDQQPNR